MLTGSICNGDTNAIHRTAILNKSSILFVAYETKSFMLAEPVVRCLTYRKFDAMELRVRCDGTFMLVVRCLAEYAPVYEKGESKAVRKQRVREFCCYRDAVKSVYPLKWLWKR